MVTVPIFAPFVQFEGHFLFGFGLDSRESFELFEVGDVLAATRFAAAAAAAHGRQRHLVVVPFDDHLRGQNGIRRFLPLLMVDVRVPLFRLEKHARTVKSRSARRRFQSLPDVALQYHHQNNEEDEEDILEHPHVKGAAQHRMYLATADHDLEARDHEGGLHKKHASAPDENFEDEVEFLAVLLIRCQGNVDGRQVAAEGDDGVTVCDDHDDSNDRLCSADDVFVLLGQQRTFQQVRGLDGCHQPIGEVEDVSLAVHFAGSSPHEQSQQHRHQNTRLDDDQRRRLKVSIKVLSEIWVGTGGTLKGSPPP